MEMGGYREGGFLLRTIGLFLEQHGKSGEKAVRPDEGGVYIFWCAQKQGTTEREKRRSFGRFCF